MSSTPTMNILLKLPGRDYDLATQPFTIHLRAHVDQMDKIVAGDGPLSQLQAVRDYSSYCRWPIRQLEYSFVIDCLPSQPDGRALDIGSGVTPWPYLLADRGWPTVSVDLEVDQVTAMRRHGLEAYGSLVDHRVADMRGMGFGSGQFSVVTCISGLKNLIHADVPVAVAEMIRVCRPGGRLILTVDVRAADDPGLLKGERAFPAATLEQIFKPVAEACGVADEFMAALNAQRQLRLGDLERFWTQHWKAGLWEEKNRGYGALGLVFDLPDDPQQCRDLIAKLRQTALAMEFPPADQPYHQVELADGQKLWMLDDPVLTAALGTENFESDVHSFFEHFLRSGDTVFDVGANVGLYEALLSRLVGPDGGVYAFEPTGQIFGCLVRNCLPLANNLRLNRIGLSTENGPLPLLHANDGNACLNSFGEPFGAGAAAEGTYASEVVWVATLDDYVRDYAVSKIDVLKIDVEGWEERVLRGGLRSLLSLAPVLVLEYCTPAARNADSSCIAISELLGALDYDLFRYQPASRSLEAVEPNRDAWSFANFIAIKRRALPSAIERLRGESLEPRGAEQPTSATANALLGSEQANGRYQAHDIVRLLEENRSLQQRLISGILDKEVTSLYHELQLSDADRAARLAVIEQQGAEIGRIPALEADIAYLKAQLAASETDLATTQEVVQAQQQHIGAIEADRAARLAVIERQGAELGRIPLLEADVARLDGVLNNLLAQWPVKALRRLHVLDARPESAGAAADAVARGAPASPGATAAAPSAALEGSTEQMFDDLQQYVATVDAFNQTRPDMNGVRNYNHQMIDILDSLRPIAKRQLLDVGASPHGYTLEWALEKNVAAYVGIGLGVPQTLEVHHQGAVGRLLNMNAEKLEFEPESFDLILSLSTFEHFFHGDKVLAEMHRVLRPGGSVLINFQPIWTCSYGHHLHHIERAAQLIPPWAHLLWDTETMRSKLRDTWPADLPLSLDEAIEWIYRSAEIIRIDIVTLRDMFHASAFEIEWITPLIDSDAGHKRVIAEYLSTILPYRADDLMTLGYSLLLNKR